MIPRRFLPIAVACLFAAGPAWGLRATGHLDALETTLSERASTLAGATDKAAKKQLRAAEKSLARIAVDTTSLAEDLKLGKKIAGPVAKAFAADDEVMDLLTAAADAFEDAVDSGARVLARAREGLPEAKLTKKADRLLGKSGKLLTKARSQSKLKKRLALLYKAQRSADKAADVLAEALGDPTPMRLVLSPATALLTAPGETVTLRAVVLDQLERPMQATVSFASSDPNVASVTPTGVASGGAVGSAQIVASVGDLAAAAVVLSARTVPGAVLVGDDQVASLPEPLDEAMPYGIGFLYTVELFGMPPTIGDLLVGTGEMPVGGLVVDVVGTDPALVTLEIRPLDELYTDLVIDEQIDSGPENLAVPDDILDAYHVEPGEDGAYVFIPREDSLEPLQARGVQGTVSDEVGPFSCSSSVAFGLGLNTAPTFSVVPSVSLDFQYTTGAGLQRLVATGGATLTASYKPRIQAALTGKVTCKARLFGMTISVPGPIALVVGGYVPIGIGFELSGTVTLLQMGFDATFSDSFSVEVGIDCTSGACEAVAGAPEPTPPATPPPPPFAWVFPSLVGDWNVGLAVSAFGYFELRIGNPLWETLQLKMAQGQAGVKQTANFAPKLSQWLNATSASSYKLSLYAKVGSGASLQSFLGLFNLNVASFEVKAELDVSNSPTAATAPSGSLTFAGTVAAGNEIEATVVLKDVTYLGLQNVEEVRFYRRDGSNLIERATVARAQNGQTTYVGRWTATADDLGEEIGVFVKTRIPLLEFEIEKNSVRTLDGAPSETGRIEIVEYRAQSEAETFVPTRHSNVDVDDTAVPGVTTTAASIASGDEVASCDTETDIEVGTDGGVEQIVISVSGSADSTEATSTLCFGVVFVTFQVVDGDVPFTFTASSDFSSNGTLAPIDAYVSLVQPSGTLESCAIAAGTLVPEQCGSGGGPSAQAVGVMSSLYLLTVRTRVNGDTTASSTMTLTFGD